MSKALEALKRLRQETCPATYMADFDKNECCDVIEQALKRLESIDNANPSEALNILLKAKQVCDVSCIEMCNNCQKKSAYDTIKQALLKAQEQEKENELLKEIIKSLFDRGCPLHQYIDKEGVLTIEVDDECSIMRLGEYKGIDLDAKLKEVLENE